ncbi:helix-hairpin-helix domain-containing protein [Micromonospora sp. WMMD712]|uniref:helix-hairpin-helix domain-containing protein n=1 Tax=Micromonospora sp. WMMD712 TaxID=3016096 RepID=UPI00249B56C6|nr:helix-hairpin-helix domain-containing protein [Micromonospora sp. WMMD712]WFE56130.1 helix-hairpin-helix domain-containing protein [Micromonospora sp. WMMD712]
MPSSFGQWLIVILALLVGAAAGWALRGRQETPSGATPIVEGDPVAGVAVVSSPVPEATVDEQRPEATVAPAAAPVAVLDQPTPDTASPTPPGGVLGDADPAAFTPAATVDAPATDGSPAVATDPEPAATPEPVAETPAPPADATPAEPTATEPTVAVEPAAETTAVEPATGTTAVEPATGTADVDPVAASTVDVEPVATEPVRPAVTADAVEPAAASAPAEPAAEAEAAAPVVPAPRTPVDDALPPAALVGPEAQHVPVEPEAAPVVAAAADPTTGSADDFRRIQGIGPKMAAALQDAGIRTYRQLADLDEATLRETIRSAGLRAAPSLATWPQQAKVLVGAPAEADRVLPAGDADA